MSPRDLPRGEIDDIVARAADRGRLQGLPYAGAITPAEAWHLAQSGTAHIVDVRTQPEWDCVGRVPGSTRVEWIGHGAPAPDPDRFLQELSKRYEPGDRLLFLCRSAVRSHHAADVAARAGFAQAFNILEGFEGGLDCEGRRGASGWRAAGLPWEQG